MGKLLEYLCDRNGLISELYKEERHRISCNKESLKNALNKNERKLLLRIIDDNNLIIEQTAEDSFINGVKIGAKLMLEVLYDES